MHTQCSTRRLGESQRSQVRNRLRTLHQLTASCSYESNIAQAATNLQREPIEARKELCQGLKRTESSEGVGSSRNTAAMLAARWNRAKDSMTTVRHSFQLPRKTARRNVGCTICGIDTLPSPGHPATAPKVPSICRTLQGIERDPPSILCTWLAIAEPGRNVDHVVSIKILSSQQRSDN